MLITSNLRTSMPSSNSSFVDKIKRKVPLIKIVAPVTVGIASALNNFGPIKSVAASILKGIAQKDLSAVAGDADKMSKTILKPGGMTGTITNGAVGFSSAVDFSIGVTEIVSGVKDKNRYLVGMGIADVIVSAGGPLIIAGLGIPAIGVVLGAAIGKVVLTLTSSQEASRIQKADAFFSLVGACAGTAIKAGIGTLPATIVAVMNTIFQLAFMNSRLAETKDNKINNNTN